MGWKHADGTPKHPGLKETLYSFSVGEGPYRMFFGWNLLGHAICFACCLLGFVIHQVAPLRLIARRVPPS